MAFDNIRLEKGLYTTGKSFTQSLEELDPTENYIGTELEGLDAFERQLKRFDIKVSGANSDSISKFYSTSDAAVLFPEYVSRAVNQGIMENSKVDDVIATTTNIDSLDYRTLRLDDSVNYKLSQVNEGAKMEECSIKLSSELTKLKKHGKMLVASYEALKYQKLDLFTVALKHIGELIAYSEFVQAIEQAVNTANKDITLTSENLTYQDLLSIWTELQPCNLTTLVMSKSDIAKLLAMPEFRDANAGLNFHGTGNLITPFGAQIISYDFIDEGSVIAIDKNLAIEKVQAGGIVTEFDKLIDCQFERAAISTIVGFSTIYGDAIAVAHKE